VKRPEKVIAKDQQLFHSEQIKQKALRLGFSDIGFTKVEHLINEEKRLKQWLDAGYHAGMGYMENHFEKRVDPSRLVPGAKTVISVLLNYYPKEHQRHSDAPKVSKYAYGKDYHFTVKAKLKQLFDFIKKDLYPGLSGRYFVDSAPVLDRAWAVRAGLGWIGKNTNLISKRWGSFVFIGEMIVNLEIKTETKEVKNACGNCTRCIDACPTGAILKPYTIDSRRCISYLTIENKDEIPDEFAGKLENYAFGCDICQDVCPWNKNIIPAEEPDFYPSDEFLDMTKEEWYKIDDTGFKKIFGSTPLKRSSYTGLKKNLDFLKKSRR